MKRQPVTNDTKPTKRKIISLRLTEAAFKKLKLLTMLNGKSQNDTIIDLILNAEIDSNLLSEYHLQLTE